MDNLGFLRVAAAVPNVKLADPFENIRNILKLASEARALGATLVLFPELSVTGYSCADLFNQQNLLDAAQDAIFELANQSEELECTIIAGAPIAFNNRLYNCAVVMQNGNILGIVPKSFLPNYNEFYEKRWFASGYGLKGQKIQIAGYLEVPFGTDLLFSLDGTVIGVEICEDMWVPRSPGIDAALAGADVICNLSATDELIGKHQYLRNLIKSRSAVGRCGYIYASAGWGESSTDLVFSGNAIIAEDGVVLTEGKRFDRNPQLVCADIDIEKLRADRRRFSSYSDPAELTGNLLESFKVINGYYATKWINHVGDTEELIRRVDPTPFVPADADHLREHCEEIISIQAWGLMRRLEACRSSKMTIGISGGLDSTLALMVAVRALDLMGKPHTDITAITMPGFGTTTRTHSNAAELMKLLGVTAIEISIDKAVRQHFSDIGHDEKTHDATYENSQARERTQILMDMANKTGGIVVGTGDLSELALGWCTYNGDQMSMYGVNASVPKTLVKYLVEWFATDSEAEGKYEIANTLRDICNTPISPELIPAADNADVIEQKTEDLVGPYELHDFFLYHTLRNGFASVKIFTLACKAFAGKYDDETIGKWLRNFYRRFFSQQFKRSCMPDGPKVGSVCLSPRGDWRMPSDASAFIWLYELDSVPQNC